MTTCSLINKQQRVLMVSIFQFETCALYELYDDEALLVLISSYCVLGDDLTWCIKKISKSK